MPTTTNDLVHLTAGGVSVVLDCRDGALPAVVHWGAALGALAHDELVALADADVAPVANNEADVPVRLALLPEPHRGWTGRPGLSGHRDGRDWSPAFTVTALHVDDTRMTAEAEDTTAGLAVRITVEVLVSGLVRTRAAVTNTAAGTYTVDDLTVALPVPSRAREVLDFAGRWGKERTPQRRELVVGTHERDSRKGRTGADAATVLSVGEPGFGFAHGEVWGVHTAWSGNHRHFAERLATGRQVVGGGELLLPARSGSTPVRRTRAPGCTARGGRASTTRRDGSTAGSAAARSTRRARGRSRSTSGRRSTSTTTSPGSPTWPSAPPASASSGTSSTTAGSAAVATTTRASATGTSTRTSGRTASVRSSTASGRSAWSSASGSSPRW